MEQTSELRPNISSLLRQAKSKEIIEKYEIEVKEQMRKYLKESIKDTVEYVMENSFEFIGENSRETYENIVEFSFCKYLDELEYMDENEQD